MLSFLRSRGRLCSHSLLLHVLLVLMCANVVLGHMYFNNSSPNSWNGDCGSEDCHIGAPCSWPANMANTVGTGPCEIFFLADTYTTPIVWSTSDVDVYLYIQNGVANLSFSLTTAGGGSADGLVFVDSHEPLPMSPDTVATIRNVTLTITSGADVDVADIIFLDSFLTISALGYPVHIHDCNFSRPAPNYNGPSELMIVACDHLFFDWVSADVGLGTFYFFTRGSMLGYFSSIEISNSTFSAVDGSPSLTSLPPSVLKIADSNLENVKITTGNAPGYFYASHVHFIHCYFQIHVAVEWSNLTFIQANGTDVVLYGTTDNSTMENISITNDISNTNTAHLAIYGNRNINSSNVIVSDLLMLTAAVHMRDVEITNSIKGNLMSDSFLYALPGSTWNFHSIDIITASVRVSDLSELVYTPSNLNKGISLNLAAFSPAPPLVAIAWTSNSPPSYLTEYPIINVDAQILQSQVAVDVRSPDYAFTASFLHPPTLSFRSFYVAQPTASCANPPPGFQCSATGILYAPGSVSGTSIVIPSGAGTVSVFGNITVSTGLQFVGTDSTLVATGCVQVPSVTIQLEHGKPVPKGPVTLITQSTANCNSLSVPITVVSAKSDCNRIDANHDANAPANTLTVLFKVDSSKCNTKWIILGAVLGGVLLITLILVLVFTLVPSARAVVRPFTNRATIAKRATM